MAEEYTVGEWGGVVHYQCTACPYDTFDGMQMLNHLVDVHNSEPALEKLLKLEEDENGTNDIDENSSEGPVPDAPSGG